MVLSPVVAPKGARALFSNRARSFSLAARLLPASTRVATETLYAFARTVDDLVDEPPDGVGITEQRERLAAWRAWLSAWPSGQRPDGSVPDALDHLIAVYHLPTEYLLLLVDGVASDLDRCQIETWPDLQHYCYQVASSVGLAMCHLLGAGNDEIALQAATNLGIAMQLTNILRDVGGDLATGRVYLPLEHLRAHGYDRDRLGRLAREATRGGRTQVDPSFRLMMDGLVQRARGYYDNGLLGIWRLPREAQVAILLAAQLYRGILDEIEAADYDVFTRRASTSPLRKMRELVRCWAMVQLGGTRRGAFETAVDEPFAFPGLSTSDIAVGPRG